MTIIVVTDNEIVADGATWSQGLCVQHDCDKIYRAKFQDWDVYITGAGILSTIIARRRMILASLRNVNTDPTDFQLYNSAEWKKVADTDDSTHMLVVFAKGGSPVQVYDIYDSPVPIKSVPPVVVGHAETVACVYGGLDAGATARDAITNALHRTGLSGTKVALTEYKF